MNIKYLKYYVQKCIDKGIQPSFEGLKIWYKDILR